MNKDKRQKASMGQRLASTVDNVVGIFNPQKAYQRRAYRFAIQQQDRFLSFRGAKSNRLTDGWLTSAGSPDQDILPDLPTLREKSRDLNRNDAIASGVTNTINTNTVGTGIRPQARLNSELLGISSDEAVMFQAKAEAIWHRWSKFADAGERMDFYEIQSLIDRQIIENGEIFVLPLMVKDSRRPYNLALDLVEADRVESPKSKAYDAQVRSGIKIGSRGEPLLYYILDTHPGDITIRTPSKFRKYKTYPAINQRTGRKNVYHLYEIKRPGQTRGYPFFAPVIDLFKNLDEYLEAELVAARVAACFSVFITKNDPYSAASNVPGGTNSAGQKINEVEPGIVEYLAPGEEPHAFNPQRPGQGFDSFVMLLLRMIASSLNISYELVIKDYTKSNYSNTRASLLQAYKYFKTRQNWMSKKFCQPIYEMVIEEAVLRGELRAKNFYALKDEWCRCRWIADGWEWIDPLKEVKANIEGRDANIITLSDITAARGADWEETMEQIAREKAKVKQLEKKYDVKFEQDKKTAAAPAEQDKNDDDEEEQPPPDDE